MRKGVQFESRQRGEIAAASGRPHVRRGKQTSIPSLLTPDLKDFIDRVIVPLLVKDYLSSNSTEGKRAESDCDVAKSTRNT